MDPTASEANVVNSIKKYLIDTLETGAGKKIAFDAGLADPYLHDKSITAWISVQFGSLGRQGLSMQMVDLFCGTRKDSEGVALAGLSDTVFAALVDDTQPDGRRRIPLYDTASLPWSQIGTMTVSEIHEGRRMEGPDETKFKPLTCTIMWVAKA